MRHPEFPVVSFLCLPLLLCPLASHIRARSVSTLALIAWLSVMSIIRGVNTLVWANNTVIRLEVWCDITTKIAIGFTYAVPAAALCIMRHLERVASTRHVMTTKEDKRRRQWFEAIMCFGVPILFMCLHYIVQGHRYDLLEDLGCTPAQYISAAAVVILWVPPLVISLATMVHAGLALRHFLRHRISFATHLRNSHSSMNPGRYFRLMALAIVVTIFDSGTNIYLLYFNVSLSGLRPYISWDNVHSNFSRIAVFPLLFFPPWLIKQFILQWWIIPMSCLLFFFFLGFGEEATTDYRAAFVWFRQTILRQNLKPSNSCGGSLPTHYSPYPRDVDVTFPAHDAFRDESKGWEELSLKMPEFLQEVSVSELPSKTESDQSQDRTLSRVFHSTRRPPQDSHLTSVIDVSRKPSLDETVSSFSTSSPTSYANFEDLHAVSQMPTVIVTEAETEVSYMSNGESLSAAQTLSPQSHEIPPPTPSRASSTRRSMSSDLGITISEAYFPDTDTTSRAHEAQFRTTSTAEPHPAFPAPAYPHPQAYPLPHGGIHMTVEKSVM